MKSTFRQGTSLKLLCLFSQHILVINVPSLFYQLGLISLKMPADFLFFSFMTQCKILKNTNYVKAKQNCVWPRNFVEKQ